MNDELFDFDTVHRLIPHSDKMCLWEAVAAFDDDSVQCRTTRHLDPDHPLKRDGRLSKLHLIEFGAQTIAIHGGLKAQTEAENTASPFAKTPRPGYLASVKNITFGDFDPQTAVLTGQATQLMAMMPQNSINSNCKTRTAKPFAAAERWSYTRKTDLWTNSNVRSSPAQRRHRFRHRQTTRRRRFHVIVHANHNLAKAESIVADLTAQNLSAEAVQFDITQADAVETALNALLEQGADSIIVNNAGITTMP